MQCLNNLEFQLYDFFQSHELDDDSEDNDVGKYVIHMFGRTLDDKSVYCRVNDYTPYFYVKYKTGLSKHQAKDIVAYLKYSVWKKYKNTLIDWDITKRKIGKDFNGDKSIGVLRLQFNSHEGMLKYSYALKEPVYIPSISKNKVILEQFESNFLPMLRCLHIRNIPGCGWIKVEKDINLVEDESDKITHCDIEFSTDWTNLISIEKDAIAPIRIASFDIETYSIDGQFPQEKRPGDKIIQIGTTHTRNGESKCYRQHIVTLKDCDDIEGAVVESYNKEKNVIKAWFREIINSDCDILTGYNTFFFDEKYIAERCLMHDLGVERFKKRFDKATNSWKSERFIDLDPSLSFSKFKNFTCTYRTIHLGSSALGDNIIKNFDTPGRVHVDLMKCVQKDHNYLECYKLDAVASSFIRSEIKDIKYNNDGHYILNSKTVKDIDVGDFIHIETKNSFVSDILDWKFYVDKIDGNHVYIKTDININEFVNFDKQEVFWSQAKDDLDPKDLFRLQLGNSTDRAIVAKYCLKDCRLVNILINKLDIIMNNIQMSNVCYVPLSYLFTRGQGIKTFSLVLRKFRQEGYIFPVIREADNEHDKFEGAIVFEPVPGIYTSPLTTLDYASLYPKSIIHKNISHETIVVNDEYDNLEDYEYFNAKYVNTDGSLSYCRFAKRKDGKLGIIPQILNDLLGERSRVKQLMKIEEDVFKKKILDGQQLALKVTANSLYGQLGAKTSSIFYRELAACTTSTGREMLLYAKKYVEEIFPLIMNGLLLANDDEHYNRILQRELIPAIYDDPKKFTNSKENISYILDYMKTNKTIIQPIIKYGDTDSVFIDWCFFTNVKKLEFKESLCLWKNIIRFGKKLLGLFITGEEKSQWKTVFNTIYNEDNITDLKLYNVDLELCTDEKSMKMFTVLKVFMEERYLPWLWSLQDSITLNKYNFERLIMDYGKYITNEFGLTFCNKPYNYCKHILIFFLKNVLKTYRLQPYMFVTNTNKINIHIKLYTSGEKLVNHDSLKLAIKTGIVSGELIKSRLPFPHDLEYEKTYYPFLIQTKKKYFGHKYEFDPTKYEQNSMGIVLKRRDNAPIVKVVCGGIVNCLVKDKDPEKAKLFTKNILLSILNNEFDVRYYLTSKKLKMFENYSDWRKIAHAVLADRIGHRDPGNKPQPGDRVRYGYIKVDGDKRNMLQGDFIETPEYIKENNLKLDYIHYIRNQIMNPAIDFLKLAIGNSKRIFDEVLEEYE